MTTTLGKRKLRATSSTRNQAKKARDVSPSEEDDAQAIFRRHFEAQFKPLPAPKKIVKIVEEVEDESDDRSSWDGISEVEEDAVQVVEHTDVHAKIALMSKEELKAFMVCLL